MTCCAYRCNKRIFGYEHFGGSCVLFDPEEVARYYAMLAAQGEEMCAVDVLSVATCYRLLPLLEACLGKFETSA